jgi:hypothetical protein
MSSSSSSSSSLQCVNNFNEKLLTFIEKQLDMYNDYRCDFQDEIVRCLTSLTENDALDLLQNKEKIYFSKFFNVFIRYFLVCKYQNVCNWLTKNHKITTKWEYDFLKEYIEGTYENYDQSDEEDDEEKQHNDYTKTDEFIWKSKLINEWIQNYKPKKDKKSKKHIVPKI